jgi:hypothetical protein
LEAVRINNVSDNLSIVQRREEDEVGADDFVLVAVKVGDAERGLPRVWGIAIPKAETLAL